MKTSYAALCAAVILTIPHFAEAQQSVDAKVVEASLFKNGLSFLVREAEVPGPGEYLLQNLPAPVHGSFWILPEAKATTVQEAVAFSAPRSETEEAVTFLELLQANVGKKVEVRTEADGWTAGTVVTVPEREPKLPVTTSAAESRRGYYGYGSPSAVYRPPSAEAGRMVEPAGFVMLRTIGGGMLALPPGAITGVRSVGDDLALAYARRRPGAALRLKVAGEGGRVRVAYLEWGLTWAPSYQVDLSDPQEVSLQCKAEVINDVEDLQGATVNLITGYPNLAFAEAVSPLALLGDASDFLQSLMALSVPRRGQTPVIAQQAVMGQGLGSESGGVRPTIPGEGEVREDLFLYPQPDMTLRRGERGYYPLFAKRVPYDDLHLWEIEDSLDEQSRWRYDWWYDQGSRPREQPEEVWHSLRLTNAGGIPWTTAPAMTVQEGRVLGQDTLFYTSSGAKTLLKITRAIDVRAEQSETEVERQRNARTAYSGRQFDLVTLKGELRVFNHKNRPITLLIKKTLSGEVLETSPQPSIETRAEGAWRVNPQQLLTWELPVEAGGKLYVSYRYRVYATR